MAQVNNNQVILSIDEQNTLRDFRENAQWGEAYQYVGGLLRSLDDADSLPADYEPVMLWFEGASLVNLANQAGESAFSDLIRFYSARQTELHFGSATPAYGEDMQRASDRVAENAINDVLSNGVVPQIGRISEHDATAVGDILFGAEEQDTAFSDNAAWSGTTLFSLLGNDQTGLLLRDRGDASDAENFNNLEDLRNSIFAVDAFNFGVQQAVAGFDVFSGDWGDIFPTGWDTFWNANNSLDLASSFASSLASGTYEDFLLAAVAGDKAASAVEFVVQQDRLQLVEDLSALFGSSSSGLDTSEVTPANFVARAHSVFSHIETNNQLSLSITPLDSMNAGELFAAAQRSLAYRYALVNANAFVLENAESVYQQQNTAGEYDLANLTDQYLQDRAEYLTLLWERNANDSELGVLPTPGSELFETYQDLSTDDGFTVLPYNDDNGNTIFATKDAVLPPSHTFTTFGSANGDNLQGNQNDDRLYGGDGHDTLDGGKGNDYLEGGLGSDVYRFSYGDGKDVVVDASGLNQLFIEHEHGAGQQLLQSLSLIEGSDSIYAEFDGDGNRINNTTYLLVDAHTSENSSAKNLLINIDGGRGGSITVQNWNAGSFGVTVDNGFAFTAPVADNVVTSSQVSADIQYVEQNADPDQVINLQAFISPDSYTTSQNDHVSGTNIAEVFVGGHGSDALYGHGGHDRLWGYSRYSSNPEDYRDQLPEHIYNDFVNQLDSQIYWTDEYDYTKESASSGDLLDGGAGNDILSAAQGNDVLIGGTGEDVLYAGEGADYAVGNDGSDTILGDTEASYFLGYRATLIDSADADVNYDDVIDGGRGDDYLAGEIGNDVVNGGDGTDIIWGDRWSSESDFDRGFTGSYDNIFAGNYPYHLPVSDPLETWHFTALPEDLQGDDILSGGEGGDYLYGNGGNDTLIGGTEDDYLNGGAGDDTYVFNAGDSQVTNGKYDTLDDKQGANRLQFNGAAIADMAIRQEADGYMSISYGGSGHNTDKLLLDIESFYALESVSVGGREYSRDEFASAFAPSSDNTIFYAGQGVTEFTGGTGNDTYVFTNEDSGNYRINLAQLDVTSQDSLRFVGISQSDVQFYRNGATRLLLDVNTDSEEPLTIEIFYYTNLEIHRITFGEHINLPTSVGDWASSTFGQLFDAYHEDDRANIDAINTALRIGETPLDAIYGTRDNDELTGNFSGSTIYGLFGNDTIIGGANSNYLDGGIGSDTIIGGGQSDTIYGGHNGDDLSGGGGRDSIYGGAGNDLIKGGYGNDLLYGEYEQDDLYGGHGNDHLDGGDNNDELYGEEGDDSLYGREGADTYYYNLGDGSDFIVTGDATQIDRLVFGAGISPADVVVRNSEGHTLTLYLPDGNTVRVEGYFDNLGTTGQALNTIEFANGTQWRAQDLIEVAVTHTNGDDIIYGHERDDVLQGGAGNDFIHGNDGTNTLYGGEGNDTLESADGSNDTLYGEAGNDALRAASHSSGILYGGEGNDFLHGGEANDWLDGGDDIDTIVAGSGDDILINGEHMEGGFGADNYVITRDAGQSIFIDNSDSRDRDELSSLNGWVDNRQDVITFGEGISPDNIGIGTTDLFRNTNSRNEYSYSQFKFRINSSDGLSAPQEVTVRTGDFNPLAYSERFQVNPVSYHNFIHEFRFADGTVWDTATLVDMFRYGDSAGSGGSNYHISDVLVGTAGHDTLSNNASQALSAYAGAGDDTLTGGINVRGQGDQLYGSRGSDRYEVRLGSNASIIDFAEHAAEGDQDTLFIQSDTAFPVRFSTDNNDLLLQAGENSTVRIVDGFAGNGAGVESFQFDVGLNSYHLSLDDATAIMNGSVIAHDDQIFFGGSGVQLTTADLLANDFDNGRNDSVITGVSNAVGGTVNFNAQTGTINFVVATGYSGALSFDYTLRGGNGEQLTATANLVNNTPPVIGNLNEPVFAPFIDRSFAFVRFPDGFYQDGDGDAITVTIEPVMANGEASPSWVRLWSSTLSQNNLYIDYYEALYSSSREGYPIILTATDGISGSVSKTLLIEVDDAGVTVTDISPSDILARIDIEDTFGISDFVGSTNNENLLLGGVGDTVQSVSSGGGVDKLVLDNNDEHVANSAGNYSGHVRVRDFVIADTQANDEADVFDIGAFLQGSNLNASNIGNYLHVVSGFHINTRSGIFVDRDGQFTDQDRVNLSNNPREGGHGADLFFEFQGREANNNLEQLTGYADNSTEQFQTLIDWGFLDLSNANSIAPERPPEDMNSPLIVQGTSSADNLLGSQRDDIFFSGGLGYGVESIRGNGGADKLILQADDTVSVDTADNHNTHFRIRDFVIDNTATNNEADVLDISDIISGFDIDVDNLGDHLHIVSGTFGHERSSIFIDLDGSFTQQERQALSNNPSAGGQGADIFLEFQGQSGSNNLADITGHADNSVEQLQALIDMRFLDVA